MTKTFYIDTLGCAKNEVDSQLLAASLVKRGCSRAEDPEEADLLIVNTCGFIEAAKVESIEHIFDLARQKGTQKKLVVTGCLSERYHQELLKEIPEVDLFTGVNDYDKLPDLLLGETAAGDQVRGTPEPVLPYQERLLPEQAYTENLKIAEGCSNACAFCAIPQIRGPYRSKRMEDCLREAEVMAEAGVREICVIAQDTSRYGIDLYGRPMLPELLTELARIEGIRWIRLMYVYDDGITDELIDVIAREEKICSYIDMPIQHVSDPVLRGMRRRSTGASIRATIDRLRAKIPGVRIRTTLLVGFPGETEEDVQTLLCFLKETKVDRVGAFAYSDEEGTPAFGLPGKLPAETIEERLDRVMSVQMQISEELNEKMIGQVYDVMIDEVHEEGYYTGRTVYDAPEIDNAVSFHGAAGYEPGEIVPVLITDAYEYDLAGEEACNESAE